MNGVPNEILAEILSKLDNISLIKSREICRIWRDLSDNLIEHRIKRVPVHKETWKSCLILSISDTGWSQFQKDVWLAYYPEDR